MPRILIRLIINAIALWVAAQFVGGMELTGTIGGLFWVAIVFGVINALIRPIVSFFTCPFYLLTLGLFTFVVNALMLMLTAYLTQGNLDFSNFGSAFIAGIVISIVSTLLSWFLPDRRDVERKRR
jgi:putative membrane protein